VTSFDDAFGTVMRLSTAAEALAALTARLRADVEGIDLDPDVAARIDAVVSQLGVDVAQLTPEQARRLAMAARSFLLQAADLLADPGRAPGWSYDDPVVLLSTGKLSAHFASIIAEVAPSLEGLADALKRDGAAFLDVGAGVAALSIALCETWSGLRVVALDPWPPAIALAEQQVAASAFADRVDLRPIRIEDLPAGPAFDAAWLSGPFMAPDAIPAALARLHDALKPGGWLLFARYASPPDPLAEAVTRLRVVRSGGSVAGAEELGALLAAAGFEDVHEVPRTWQAPIGFIVGRRRS
jgi:SAM-dependent methyltransferase